MRRAFNWLGWLLIVGLGIAAITTPPRNGLIKGEYFPEPHEIFVIDGDTISFNDRRIRLQGFDAPEIRDAECDRELDAGQRAKDRLRELIDTQPIRLELLKAYDKYGRDLGRLFLDGTDVRDILTEEGLAQIYQWGVDKSWCN